MMSYQMTLELTVFHSKESEGNLQTRLNHLEEKLKSLQERGTIDSYTKLVSLDSIRRENNPTRGGQARWGTERFDKYRQWARRTGVGLGPGFMEREVGHTRLEFPSLYLIARSHREIKGVFPCVDRDPVKEEYHVYTITDYLEALEVGENWRTARPSDPSQLVYTNHDRIQAWLAAAPERYFSEWDHFETEYSLSSANSLHGDARVDLVFQQADGSERYLLVEVKPERDKVDKAFGQLLRYRHAFAEHHTTPGLRLKDIELAIATPEVDEYHERAASELGITVIHEFEM